jgi:hypothetical protein
MAGVKTPCISVLARSPGVLRHYRQAEIVFDLPGLVLGAYDLESSLRALYPDPVNRPTFLDLNHCARELEPRD